MPATANVYQSGLMKCLDGTIALLTDTIKALLVKSTETGAVDDDFVADVNEISGVSGYTGGFGGAGRKALASKTLTVDDANDRFVFDAADISFGTLGTGDTIGGVVICKEITDDASSPIIARCGCTDTPTNGSPVTFQFDSVGILTVAAA